MQWIIKDSLVGTQDSTSLRDGPWDLVGPMDLGAQGFTWHERLYKQISSLSHRSFVLKSA